MSVERPMLAGFAGTCALVAATATWARVHRAGRPRPVLQADAIVVFGAAVRASGPSPELQARLEHAAELHRRGCAPAILCSGGFSRGVCEASAMRAALLRLGIPSHAVLMDDQGRSTRHTVAAIKRRFGQWRSAIAVSSPYHMHRILRESRRQGVELIPSPALRVGPRTRQHLREVAAVWWYALARPA
jgi:uncharacterized SAM-binding protein YcdF (DUF218 family)